MERDDYHTLAAMARTARIRNDTSSTMTRTTRMAGMTCGTGPDHEYMLMGQSHELMLTAVTHKLMLKVLAGDLAVRW